MLSIQFKKSLKSLTKNSQLELKQAQEVSVFA